MSSVYQAGGIYQRQTSNTNLTLQKRRFLDKRRSFDRRRQLDYLPYFSVILVNRCYFISFLYDKRAHKSAVILLNILSYPHNVSSQKGIILKDVTKTRNRKRSRSQHGDRENKKWEQNLAYTVVTSFQIPCFVLNFQLPFPRARYPLPVSRFSHIPILNYRLPSNTIATCSLGLSSPTVNTMTSIMARAYIS